ncbi:D-arabinono-1,4-lactone oxidase [Aeromicrobium sp. Leaf350]|uniref:D-arabinono-1,4-lactone oxidase n=1 Tax=Aeromicrobium sp. Leaf350 TaxID=2876565 RepID=UPI001E2FF947|nr:D-arabinono-1,4-lactone oxidase [Aeromicrobium sp. Leaf350]
MTTSTTWSNWAGNVRTSPVALEHPASTADVQALVARAAREKVTIKAHGAGHSFTSIAATEGISLSLSRMNRVLDHDTTTGLVRVQAGISLHELNPLLKALGLALPNLGDVDPQSVAGAISTGTHGTGGRLHGIAAAVEALQLVTGDGEVLEIGPDHAWARAVPVGLGALGIVTEVTLRCVPAFLLEAREEPAELPDLVGRLDELADDYDHAEFYWFPHTEKALLKRNSRVPSGTEPRPLSRLRHWWDDELLSNTVYERVQRVAARRPSVIPRINSVSGSMLGARTYVSDSYDVFVSPRRVRFRESEFAVPRAALPAVIAELQAWFAARHELVSFPIEVRFTGADDVWMSTGFERDNAYVAVHQYHRTDPTAYFAAAQDVFTAHEGRPHWGKMHTLGSEYFRERYPRFDDFLAIREETDPRRLFTNPYLDRVLGT